MSYQVFDCSYSAHGKATISTTSTSTSTVNLVGKNLQISHQPLKAEINVENVTK